MICHETVGEKHPYGFVSHEKVESSQPRQQQTYGGITTTKLRLRQAEGQKFGLRAAQGGQVPPRKQLQLLLHAQTTGGNFLRQSSEAERRLPLATLMSCDLVSQRSSLRRNMTLGGRL